MLTLCSRISDFSSKMWTVNVSPVLHSHAKCLNHVCLFSSVQWSATKWGSRRTESRTLYLTRLPSWCTSSTRSATKTQTERSTPAPIRWACCAATWRCSRSCLLTSEMPSQYRYRYRLRSFRHFLLSSSEVLEVERSLTIFPVGSVDTVNYQMLMSSLRYLCQFSYKRAGYQQVHRREQDQGTH